MQHLLEIVRIIEQYKQKKLEVFHEDLMDSLPSNYVDFYNKLDARAYLSDEDAVRDIYDTDDIGDSRYKMLKHRIRRRLLNSLFFLDVQVPHFPEYDEALNECLRGIVQIETLGYFSARKTAIELTRKIHLKAVEFQFTSVELHCLRILKRHAVHLGDSKLLAEYVGLLSQCQETLAAEIEGENLMDEVHSLLIASYEKTEDLAVLAERNAVKLDFLRNKHNRTVLHISYYRIKSIAFELRYNYQETIRVCRQAEDYLHHNKRFYRKVLNIEFSQRKLSCTISLRDYTSGKRYISQTLRLVEKRSSNWYLCQETSFLWAMHSGNYKKAEEIYGAVVTSERYPMIQDNRKERWNIFEGYLEYIRESERRKRKPRPDRPIRRRFDIYNFLQEVPIFAKDKRGLYVSIMVLQILFLIEWEEFSEIIARIDALKRYFRRYIQGAAYYRTKCFQRMLIRLVNRDFDPDATEKATKDLYESLNSPESEHYAVEELEIIPYDVLWQRILETLRRVQARNPSLRKLPKVPKRARKAKKPAVEDAEE